MKQKLLEIAALLHDKARDHGSIGYGYYQPANPNDFCPDASECTDLEINAHRNACQAYDRGEYKAPERIRSEHTHIIYAAWGIGSYNLPDTELEQAACELEDLAKGLSDESPTSGSVL
jgi:hypothetical protein